MRKPYIIMLRVIMFFPRQNIIHVPHNVIKVLYYRGVQLFMRRLSLLCIYIIIITTLHHNYVVLEMR